MPAPHGSKWIYFAGYLERARARLRLSLEACELAPRASQPSGIVMHRDFTSFVSFPHVACALDSLATNAHESNEGRLLHGEPDSRRRKSSPLRRRGAGDDDRDAAHESESEDDARHG